MNKEDINSHEKFGTKGELELEIEATRLQLKKLEQQLEEQKFSDDQNNNISNLDTIGISNNNYSCSENNNELPSFISAASSLTKHDIERFSRQIIVDGIGAEGMERIKKGRVVLVGAGGLGSTIALFLAAAGVGELRIVDFDNVEESNLHRQVMHTSERLGWSKVHSALTACRAINPNMKLTPLQLQLTPANAEALVKECEVVVDGSDNVAARYLINDAAVRQRRPLVSGSAVGWEGQLSVYNYTNNNNSNNSNRGPCLRCLHPRPPPPAAVGSCGDCGVIGPVPGTIGCLQAMEVLKILANAGEVLAGRMLIMNGLLFHMRVVQLRGRQPHCVVCGDTTETKEKESQTLQELVRERPEYIVTPCASGQALSVKLLPKEARISPKEFYTRIKCKGDDSMIPFIILDVREKGQFDMAHLPGSLSLPLQQLQKWNNNGILLKEWYNFIYNYIKEINNPIDIYVVCRRGIASTSAVQLFLEMKQEEDHSFIDNEINNMNNYLLRFINVDGGLNRYHHEADNGFPYY